jgi:hypothetical protein
MEPALQTLKMPSRRVLALNETRKTLLASRVVVATGRSSPPDGPIRPGDGLWIPRRGLDSRGIPVSLDLLVLDEDHRVVAAERDLRPEMECPDTVDAPGVLVLAPGTIDATGTKAGDQILIEEILPSR